MTQYDRVGVCDSVNYVRVAVFVPLLTPPIWNKKIKQ